MPILRALGYALLVGLCFLGLLVVVGGALHLWADHQWDDQIRAIQKQQLQTPPKPPAPAPPAQ